MNYHKIYTYIFINQKPKSKPTWTQHKMRRYSYKRKQIKYYTNRLINALNTTKGLAIIINWKWIYPNETTREYRAFNKNEITSNFMQSHVVNKTLYILLIVCWMFARKMEKKI